MSTADTVALKCVEHSGFSEPFSTEKRVEEGKDDSPHISMKETKEVDKYELNGTQVLTRSCLCSIYSPQTASKCLSELNSEF